MANEWKLNEIVKALKTDEKILWVKAQPDKKILWVTDTHLNASNTDAFINTIKNSACEAIFITGDISNDNLIETLRMIADRVTKPIYFVLGNRDNAYGSSTSEVRLSLSALMKEKTNLHYLHDAPVYFEPSETVRVKTAIVGIDGYADSWNVSETQRKQDGATFERNVRTAIAQGAKRIVILTHVPPFVTDCWDKGEVTSANKAPHSSSAQSAALFLNLANEHPNVTFVVYCGHTHNSSYQAYPSIKMVDKRGNGFYVRERNLFVFVGNNFLSETDAFGEGNLTRVYTINQSRFLPDSFEFTRSGITTILEDGARPVSKDLINVWIQEAVPLNMWMHKDVPSGDLVTHLLTLGNRAD